MLLASALAIPVVPINLVYAAEAAQSAQVLSAERFAEIKTVLSETVPARECVKGKDITVILGNTGAGKSTMINFLAKTPMVVNTLGKLVPEEGKARVRVRAGGKACTKYPEAIPDSDVGMLCDLPGFQDTDSAVDDLLNAAFIRQVLTAAKSLKVLILTTEDELLSTRGKSFKELSKFMRIFQNKGFRDSACYLLVNRVEPTSILEGTTNTLYEGVFDKLDPDESLLKDLVDSKRVYYIPKTSGANRAEALARVTDSYSKMIDIINGIRGQRLSDSELNMSLSLNAETQNDIKGFIEIILKHQLNEMKRGFYQEEIQAIKDAVKAGKLTGAGSAVLEGKASAFWKAFNGKIKDTSEYQLLNPVCSKQFREAIREFEAVFYQEHNTAVQTLLIEEQAEAKRLAEEEARRKGEEADAANKVAAAKEAEAEVAEKRRQAAAIEADQRRLEAEKAREDLTLSEVEKAKFAEAAKLAEEARKKASLEADQARQDAAKALDEAKAQVAQYEVKMKDIEKKTAEMQQMYTERMAAMEREMQERRADADREKAELRREMESLKSSQAEERAALQRQLEEVEERNKRALREAEERFEKEKESMKNTQQSNQGGGRLVGYQWVPTEFGWVLVGVHA